MFAVFEHRLIQHTIDCMQFFLYNIDINVVIAPYSVVPFVIVLFPSENRRKTLFQSSLMSLKTDSWQFIIFSDVAWGWGSKGRPLRLGSPWAELTLELRLLDFNRVSFLHIIATLLIFVLQNYMYFYSIIHFEIRLIHKTKKKRQCGFAKMLSNIQN